MVNSYNNIFNLKIIRPIDLISSFHEIQRIGEKINQITMRKQVFQEGGTFQGKLA